MDDPPALLRRLSHLSSLILATALAHAIQPTAARAQDVTIDFDSLQQDVVVAQYANLGATFNSPRRRDFSATPGFAHSGAHAVELCFAIEFCTVPLRIEFTAGQSRVKVWVGNSFPLPTARIVILQALDENSALIGEAVAVLPASTDPTPVQTPLEIVATGPSIRQLLLMSSDGQSTTHYNNGLVVDDLEFTTVGGPPPCTAASAPSLVLLPTPPQTQVVSLDQFLLQGVVSTEAPLTEASLTVYAGSTTRTIDVLGTIIPQNAGTFGPMNVTGVLSPGGNVIYVRVRNCRGASGDPRVVTFNPIAGGTRVRLLSRLEVVQATQDPLNTVPLVADKPTVVRAYLTLEGATTPIGMVSGAITATRVGGEVLTPLLHSSNSLTLTPSSALHPLRLDLGASLNFTLPPEWVGRGTLHLQLSKLYIQGNETNIPCDGCANLDAIGAPLWTHFQRVRPLNLALAPFIYSNGLTPDVLFTPMGALQWVNNVFPLPGNFPGDARGIRLLRILPMRTTDKSLGASGDDGSDFLDDLEFDRLVLGVLNQGAWPADFHVFGITPCGCGGRGKTPGRVAYGDVWNQEQGSVVPQESFSDYGKIWAHELGHNLGRKHGGNAHGEDDFESFLESLFDPDVDAGFPYAHGGIGQPGIPIITEYWNAPPVLIRPGNAVEGEEHGHDFMSYGVGGYWVSPYTYFALFMKFLDLSQSQARGPGGDTELLIVGGRLNADGDVTLHPFQRLFAQDPGELQGRGPLSVALIDSAGRTLAAHAFTPRWADGDRSASFNEVIPWRPGTREIVFAGPGGVLTTRTVSPNAPRVRVTRFAGSKGGREVVVNWEAVDVDGDSLTFSVYYQASPSDSWLPLATGVANRSAVVDTGLLPGSDSARVRVHATDGVNTTIAESAAGFTVPDKPPLVGIHSPRGEARLDGSAGIELVGMAYDPEDGVLPDARLVWTSSRAGELGTGGRLHAKLSPGRHVIRLVATDSDGRRAEHSVTVSVEPASKPSPRSNR